MIVVVAKGPRLRGTIRIGLSDGPRRSDSTRKWSVAHTFYQSLAKVIHFLGIVRSKGSRNRWAIVHPTFQLELTNHFVTIGLGATLRNLVSSHGGLVEIVDKINRQLDQEISLRLTMIRIVQPIIKVGLGPEP